MVNKSWYIVDLFIFWLNSSFHPLTFTKLRFWPPKKKNYKMPPKFCNSSSFGPQDQFLVKKITHVTSLRVPRQRRPSQNWPWGPKLPQMQNLKGSFVVFFLGDQNHNFGKVRGLKLLLSLIFYKKYRREYLWLRKQNTLFSTMSVLFVNIIFPKTNLFKFSMST